MHRRRPLLSAFLASLLLVQGIAVAWSVGTMPELKAASEQAMGDMPCHGAATVADAESERPACCDADCPDMTTCALGHMAVTTSLLVALPAAAESIPASDSRSPIDTSPPTLLRPPIHLHG
jgi:hypothetical protein